MNPLTTITGNTDVYLLDQIMKGRYRPSDIILDAGAGGGRNLYWFVQQGFTVYGTDRDPAAVYAMQQQYPQVAADRFILAPVEALPFPRAHFDHVISSAVLHFADNPAHFEQMFGEMVRVLKPGGSLFIRMATDVGVPLVPLGNGRYHLPDGSERYVLTKPALEDLMAVYGLRWLEAFKTVVVDGVRSMGVVVLGRAPEF